MNNPQKRTINTLIIDDDLIVQATIKSMLKKIEDTNSGIIMRIAPAYTVSEALKNFENSINNTQTYDLILLDLSIDEINDGFDLIPVFKTHSPNTHVVVITASLDHSTTMARSLSAGANGYVKKPITTATKKFEDIITRIYKLRTLEAEMQSLKNKF